MLDCATPVSQNEVGTMWDSAGDKMREYGSLKRGFIESNPAACCQLRCLERGVLYAYARARGTRASSAQITVSAGVISSDQSTRHTEV